MNNFKDVVELFIGLIAMLVPVIFALTFLIIAWGVIKAWIINGGDEASVQEGKNIAIVGTVALVFMFGIWGILSILQSSIF
jgi:hypothetical protein